MIRLSWLAASAASVAASSGVLCWSSTRVVANSVANSATQPARVEEKKQRSNEELKGCTSRITATKQGVKRNGNEHDYRPEWTSAVAHPRKRKHGQQIVGKRMMFTSGRNIMRDRGKVTGDNSPASECNGNHETHTGGCLLMACRCEHSRVQRHTHTPSRKFHHVIDTRYSGTNQQSACNKRAPCWQIASARHDISCGRHSRTFCEQQNRLTGDCVVVEGDERRHELELLHSFGICKKIDKTQQRHQSHRPRTFSSDGATKRIARVRLLSGTSSVV